MSHVEPALRITGEGTIQPGRRERAGDDLDGAVELCDRRTTLGSPGLDELRWLNPVRPGDTLTGWVECAAKVPSKSRPSLGVIHEQWTVTNQKGEVVMTTKGINMVRRRPA